MLADTDVVLPDVITQYLAAQPRNASLIDRYFAEDACVMDRGELYKGRESMIAWQEQLTLLWPGRVFEPLKTLRSRSDHEYAVQVHVTGPFPGGSSMKHLFRFRVQDDKIALLEII